MDMMQRAFESARGQQQKPQVQQQGCPVDREELGVSTWALLHTLAANIPEEPTEEEQKMLHQMVVGLARFYPCSICATDFQQSVASNPPATQSRAAFSLWMCRLHNEVNIKIGKGEFPCAVDKLDLRWRDGGTACDEEPIARSSADDEAAPREQLEGIFHKERTKSNAH
jgi:FAD-linked sulfhydryl oxidase